MKKYIWAGIAILVFVVGLYLYSVRSRIDFYSTSTENAKNVLNRTNSVVELLEEDVAELAPEE